ncbi:MAG: MCE family protein [Pseudomonadota bacterium]|nr:MAG: MCE family protein [Pseudomonadota bacterium]
MAIMHDEDVRFRNLSRKIGWFVIVAVVGIALMFVGVGMRQELFTPKTTLYFISDSGTDIKKGMAVKLSGFRIGRVEALELTSDAEVKVTMSINRAYMKWVRRDSTARVAKESLLGDTIIEIPPGSDSAAVLKDNERIEFTREAGLGQVVDKLYAQVTPLIADIRSITAYLNNPHGDVKQSLHKLNLAMSELNATLARLDRIMQAAEKDVPGTLRTARETIDNSKKVVDSVSRTWPINRNIAPPQSETLQLDSYPGARPSREPGQAP